MSASSSGSGAGGGAASSLLAATSWMIAATLLWTSVGVAVRFLEGRVAVTDLSLFRAVVASAIMLPLVWRHRREVGITRVGRRAALLYFVRAVVTFVGQGCYYFALTYIPLAEATVLNATVPIFFVLLAVLVLREWVDATRWFAILLGFVGVAIIIRPGVAIIAPAAVIALVSAVLFAVGSTINKMLSAHEPASRIVFNTNVLMALIGASVFVATGLTAPAWSDVPLILAVAAPGTMAQYCIARALAVADASFVGPIDFIRVPMAALVGWILFAELPVIWVWIGSAVVFVSVVVLTRSSILKRAAQPSGSAPPVIGPDA